MNSADTHSATRKRSPWRKLLRVVLLVALFWIVLRWFEHMEVYHPVGRLDWTPADAGWKYEEVRVTTRDGVELYGWWMPAPSPDGPGAGRALLLFHGNGGNISHRTELYSLCRALNLGVLAVDYRGYGLSRGRPSEEGTYLDAEAAWKWLIDRDWPPGRILLYGESLGGAVATELACRHQPGGLILQSTFTSIPDVGAELFPFLPVRWLASIQYDTHSKLSRVRCPVLILHSRTDSLVAFHHAEQNYTAARDPKLLWELAGDHNGALLHPEGQRRWTEGMRRFLEQLADAGGEPDTQSSPAAAPGAPSSQR